MCNIGFLYVILVYRQLFDIVSLKVDGRTN